MTKSAIVNTITILAVIIMTAGCGKNKTEIEASSGAVEAGMELVKLTPASVMEIGLKTETIQHKPLTKYFTIPAKVVANQDNEAIVGSLVQGRVCKVFAKTGDYVNAGQKLMLVEGLEIGEIKAGFISAKANLAYQKASYERQKKLLEENVGAQKNLLETLNEFEKARAEYAAQKNKINAIGLSAEEVMGGKDTVSDDHDSGILPVKSPISGIVVERNVVVGQFIDETTTAFKIINLSSVWVDGQMYEKDAGRLTGTTIADFHSSSFPEDPFRGKIVYIGRIIDENTRTITVRAEFSNAAGRLKPQMFGELRMPGGNNPAGLLVPAEALIKIDNTDFIFVQKGDTAFEKRAVLAGAVQNEQVEILSGLQDREKIVVKGAFYLKSELMKSSLGGE